ncbi:hypothetical protein DM860_002617 [Cuscuta australis]|uniref:Uncharacterized protein n=1 Tax=Cuscuta australis TaxID=267555 RepID=A0A328D2M5_9ASTE|nr:hypothetical protein DM860_002617 [Cuscuta australis]
MSGPDSFKIYYYKKYPPPTGGRWNCIHTVMGHPFIGKGGKWMPKKLTYYLTRLSPLLRNVEVYLLTTRIACIATGNEVLPVKDTALSGNMLPAMQRIHTALVNLGLDAKVEVTTAHSLALLETLYPPAAGSF